MRTLLLLMLSAITLFTNAQIVIESSDFPIDSNAVFSWDICETLGQKVPAEGENLHWDYTDLAINGVKYTESFLAANHPSFPTAINYRPDSMNFGGVAVYIHEYFLSTTSFYYSLGEIVYDAVIPLEGVTGDPNDEIFFPLQSDVLTNPEILALFPVQYGSSWSNEKSNSTSFNVTIAMMFLNNTPGEQKHYENNTVEVVGYGTISVPTLMGGSAPVPCLLVKEEITEIDSLFLDGSPMPVKMMNALGMVQGEVTESVDYHFIRKGSSQVLLTVGTADGTAIEFMHLDDSGDIPLNSPPTIANPITDRVANIGVNFQLYIPEDVFVDPDTLDVLELSIGLQSGDTMPTWLSYNDTTRMLEGVPTENDTIYMRVTATDLAGDENFEDFKIYVNGENSIEDYKIDALKVYPNPANNLISIVSNQKNIVSQLQIFNVVGKRIMTIDDFVNKKSVDVSNLDNGIYFIRDIENYTLNKFIICR